MHEAESGHGTRAPHIRIKRRGKAASANSVFCYQSCHGGRIVEQALGVKRCISCMPVQQVTKLSRLIPNVLAGVQQTRAVPMKRARREGIVACTVYSDRSADPHLRRPERQITAERGARAVGEAPDRRKRRVMVGNDSREEFRRKIGVSRCRDEGTSMPAQHVLQVVLSMKELRCASRGQEPVSCDHADAVGDDPEECHTKDNGSGPPAQRE